MTLHEMEHKNWIDSSTWVHVFDCGFPCMHGYYDEVTDSIKDLSITYEISKYGGELAIELGNAPLSVSWIREYINITNCNFNIAYRKYRNLFVDYIEEV